MSYRKRIEEVFGVAACCHALFYVRPGGLRFELSEGGSPLNQVLVAFRKAILICEDIFDGLDSIPVCLRTYMSSNRFTHRDDLKELGLAGISIPRDRSIWIEETLEEGHWEGNETERWLNVAFDVPFSKLQNLVWCALTRDFATLRPNPGCRIYLFNFADKIMAHPYDDRGMDVVGSNEQALRNMYVKYNHFLLDYDRNTMDSTFGAT